MQYLSALGGRQNGSTLVVTLLVMTSLTILGVMSIHTSVLEIQIGQSERQAREVFYLAESSVMEGIQWLLAMSHHDLNEHHAVWYHPGGSEGDPGIDFRDPGQWVVNSPGAENAVTCSLSPFTHVAAVERAVATGESLVLSNSRLYLVRLYGLCTLYGINNLIEIGYYMRY